MNWLLALIPGWVKYAAIGILLAALVAGGLMLKRSWQNEATLQVQLKDAQAVIDQKVEDAKTSADILEKARLRVKELEIATAPVIKVISNAPLTYTCPDIVRGAAADGVRSLLSPSGGPPAGPNSAGALRAPRAPAGTTNR